MNSAGTIQLRDPTGWRVFVDPVTATASIFCSTLVFHNVAVFGCLAGLSAWSSARVLLTDRQFTVVVGLRALGGGCVSCKQKPTKVIPLQQMPPRQPTVNPQTQAMAEFLVKFPFHSRIHKMLPVFRLEELESIEPVELTDPFAVAKPLMAAVLQSEHWTDPQQRRTRFRLVRLVRRFWFSCIFRQFAQTGEFPYEEPLLEFFRQVQELGANEEAAREARKVLQACEHKTVWADWLQKVEAAGKSLFSVYFGEQPSQSAAYALFKLDSVKEDRLLDLVLLLFLDQICIVRGSLAQELFVAALEMDLEHVLFHFEVEILTRHRFTDPELRLITERLCSYLTSNEVTPVVQEKACDILQLLPTTPKLEYLVRQRRPPSRPAKVVYLPEVRECVVEYSKDLLESARLRLLESKKLVVRGEGGSGKSQFMYEFAIAYQEHYDVVYWIYAPNTEDVEIYYLGLMKVLGISLPDTTMAQRIDFIKTFLAKSDLKVLLLFAACQSEKDVHMLIPQNAHVLISTVTKYETADITVPPLELEQAEKVFRAISGFVEVDKDELALFDGSPLALVHLAAAMKHKASTPLPAFTQSLRRRLAEIKNSLCKSEVFVLLESRMEFLKAQSKGAYTFLMHLSFFPPFQIPKYLYEEILKVLRLTRQSLFIKNLLVKHGFIHVSSDSSITLNRTMSYWIRFSVTQKEPISKVLINIAISLTHELYSLVIQGWQIRDFDSIYLHLDYTFRAYQDIRRLAFHEALIQFTHITYVHYRVLNEDFPVLFSMGLRMHSSLLNSQSKSDALLQALLLNEVTKEQSRKVDKCQQLLNLLEEKYNHMNIQHADWADAYFLLGQAELEAGMFEAAEVAHSKALEIRKQLSTEDTLGLARSVEALALVHAVERCEIESVRREFEEALQIKQKCLFEYHPEVADTLWNFAVTLDEYGFKEEALMKYQQSLTVKLAYYGNDHPDVANTFIILGELHCTVQKIDRALEFYRQAAKSLKVLCMPKNLNLLQVYSKIGQLYRELGNEEKAEQYLSKGEQVKSRIFVKAANIPSEKPGTSTEAQS